MVMFINLVVIPYLRKNENADQNRLTLMEQVIYSKIFIQNIAIFLMNMSYG